MFIILADDKPERTVHPLNKIRPWRFSNRIESDELKLLVSDRPIQAETEYTPWTNILLSSDAWLFTFAWFFATGSSK